MLAVLSTKMKSIIRRHSRVALVYRWQTPLLGLVAVAAVVNPLCIVAQEELPTGKAITPSAANGATFQYLNPHNQLAPKLTLNGAASVAVAPNGKLLALITSGYNKFADASGKFPLSLSTEYLFFFDVRGPEPKQIQAIPVRATMQGLSWAPSSKQVYVSGGVDDAVHEFTSDGQKFQPTRTFALRHRKWIGGLKDVLNESGSAVSAVAVSPDGRHLLVANYMNDSISLIDLRSGRVIREQDLRPGIIDPRRRGEPGGSYPRALVWISPNRAYVASERDREIIALHILPHEVIVARRIRVPGQPVALVANRRGSRVYVALDTSGQVGVLDTSSDRLIELIDAVAPPTFFQNTRRFGGANTNALALVSDEHTLLVSNGGENAIAVIRLGEKARGAADPVPGKGRDTDDTDRSAVVGLVPTGWYPDGVAASVDGARWFVVNGKSPTGPNSGWCDNPDPARPTCKPEKYLNNHFDSTITAAENSQVEQLEKGGFLTLPAPPPLELARLTKLVVLNNRMDRPDQTKAEEELFALLRQRIKHVIYIMKENRSYDQILGDLKGANGAPRLTLFPERITPNHHAIARSFVTLDNTLVSAEGSIQGFMWTYAGQTNDHNERNEPLAYVGRAAMDGYGENRGMNMGLGTSAERHAEFAPSPTDPDILPGTHDVNAPDGPDGMEGLGFLWDVALRKGVTIRNYGLSPGPYRDFGDYNCVEHCKPLPDVQDAFQAGVRVYWPSKASLRSFSDPYFRPFLPPYPDFWRAKEWKREFDEFSRTGKLPELTTMWLGGDHIGWFGQAFDGVNTPETQMADNDYALGMILQAVANSPFAKDTLVVSIEDDAWDGWDHVDAHRTVALFAGPYVRQNAVISTRYTTVNVLKTIEEILGVGPIGLNDARAEPMAEVFDPRAAEWSYKAVVPDVLYTTKLPLPPPEHTMTDKPRHPAAYWAKAMANQDFSGPDRVDPVTFDQALWRGLKGNTHHAGLKDE